MANEKQKGLNTNSNIYTIVYSAILVVIVAFLLAFVFQALKDRQDAKLRELQVIDWITEGNIGSDERVCAVVDAARERQIPIRVGVNSGSLEKDILEKNGAGMNLTEEVRDGIVNHQVNTLPFTLEGQIVRLSDKIAYVHHDMDDAIRGGILTDEDVPESIACVVGRTLGQRLDRFIHDIITSSQGKPVITMSEEIGAAFEKLRAFMFERVYTNPVAKAQESRAENMIGVLYDYYMTHPEEMPELQRKMIDSGTPVWRAVCDYISSMTDRYAIMMFESIYIPKTWDVL